MAKGVRRRVSSGANHQALTSRGCRADLVNCMSAAEPGRKGARGDALAGRRGARVVADIGPVIGAAGSAATIVPAFTCRVYLLPEAPEVAKLCAPPFGDWLLCAATKLLCARRAWNRAGAGCLDAVRGEIGVMASSSNMSFSTIAAAVISNNAQTTQPQRRKKTSASRGRHTVLWGRVPPTTPGAPRHRLRPSGAHSSLHLAPHTTSSRGKEPRFHHCARGRSINVAYELAAPAAFRFYTYANRHLGFRTAPGPTF